MLQDWLLVGSDKKFGVMHFVHFLQLSPASIPSILFLFSDSRLCHLDLWQKFDTIQFMGLDPTNFNRLRIFQKNPFLN